MAVALGWDDVRTLVTELVGRWPTDTLTGVYGVPQGGAPVACLVATELGLPILDAPVDGCLVVDDLVDSGLTAARFDGHRFDALIRKPVSPPEVAPGARLVDGWVTFPWEAEQAPTDSVVRLLQHLGEDPTRDGLRDTPGRVVKALREMTAGYSESPETHLRVTFEESCDQMVVVSDVRFVSMCEHHMLPFLGSASVGYVPDGRVVGLSKLARVVDVFARRLQVQERMTEQIAEAIETFLEPRGVGVVVRGRHSCMGVRGVLKPDAVMVTSSLRGVFLDDASTRGEFLALAHAAR